MLFLSMASSCLHRTYGKGQVCPIAGGEPRPIPGWLPEDLWIDWSADGRSAYIYDDDKIAAPVYRLDLNTGKRDLVTRLAPSDVAGVTAMVNIRIDARRQVLRVFLFSGIV